MKKIALILMISMLIPLFMTAADDLTWYTWMDEAQTAAQKADKPMLLFFTGSDWCGWCKKLVAQVLSQPAFKEYAAEELILVKLDFPKSITLDLKQKEHNTNLARKFQVQGFPTIILLNAKGEILGQTGYQDLSPEDYVKHLKAFIK